LQSIFSPQLFKPLNWPVIRNLGILSYSIYIWQMVFCSDPQNFGWPHVWFMSFPGWLLAALLAATLSYHGLEKPLMRLRARFRKAD
jgi:peptidoglycan/LPS O-acetylase OafA/YrhL